MLLELRYLRPIERWICEVSSVHIQVARNRNEASVSSDGQQGASPRPTGTYGRFTHAPQPPDHAENLPSRAMKSGQSTFSAEHPALRMPANPYSDLPASAWWHRGVVEAGSDLNPIVSPKFSVDSRTKIATCGSCFAQHLGRYLARGGHNWFVTELAPPLMTAEEAKEYQYGLFSARFGNVYNTRGLLQLLQRAFGSWESDEPPWETPDGRTVDPFRPHVQPGGFADVQEMLFDRSYHLEKVRQMVLGMEVFVFTLGLTEMWQRLSDGTALPSCPGTHFGAFDPSIHGFHNLTLAEVVEDLEGVVALLGERNPEAKILLTVSPVPLVATASGGHVLSSTTYSKSVLRVAAETLKARHAHLDYLPAYEIITGPHARGHAFAEDLRSVREPAVRHVMKCFFDAYSSDDRAFESSDVIMASAAPLQQAAGGPDVLSAICDEDMLKKAYGIE